MALKFSMILEAVDRASAPAKKVKASVGGLVAGFRAWGQQVRKISNDINSGTRSLEHYQRQARRLRQVAIGSIFRAASMQARRFADSLDRGIRKLDLLGRAGRGAKAGLGWLGGKALGAAKWAAAGAAAAGGFALFDMFKTAGQFEQYQVMLEGTEGSAMKARKAMGWVQKFAQQTPYELDQVMEAFVALKAYGIDPMNGSLQSLGDGASGMSKDLGASVEALADAITGEYERLKEFGIRASKAGDNVTFTYRKNGKDIQRTVKATGSEIEKTITGIFSDRFGGGMARQSKTLFGIMSNLKDMWSGFLLKIADAGIFDVVKRDLGRLMAYLGKLSDDGTIKAWAENISKNLEKMWNWAVKFYNDTDWKQVGADIREIASAIASAASAMASLVRWARPLLPIIQAINPLTGGLVGKAVRGAINATPTPGSLSDRNAAARNLPRTRLPSGSGNGNGWTRLPKGGAKPAGAQPTRVGGALDINVKVQGPATATVSRVATANRDVPINARLGKIMGAPA